MRAIEIARLIGGELFGNDIEVTKATSLEKAGSDDVAFLTSVAKLEQAKRSLCGLLIVPRKLSEHFVMSGCAVVFVDNSQLAMCQILDALHPRPQFACSYALQGGVEIAPNAFIGERVRIGAGSRIMPGVVIGDDVIIGENTHIYPNVCIYPEVEIGSDVIIHAGSVLGSDGFGNAWSAGRWVKIPQVGTLRIGSRVEIGANCTLDRGALDDTVIDDGVRIDNLVHVAHNVRIGENTALAGCVGIAGSTVIGRNCQIGGGIGINGHIRIADGVVVTGGGSITANIDVPGHYVTGTSEMPRMNWLRSTSHLRELDSLVKNVRAIDKKVKSLKGE